MILTVEDTFDAAHRLMHYKGLCRHLHGHTWRVVCSFSGCIANFITGMVMDFKKLKWLVQLETGKLDHAVVLNKDDPLIALLKLQGLRYETTEGEPTCENLVYWLQEGIIHRLSVHPEFPVKLVSIQLWESPTSSVLLEC
jgi:6-pyruvoyltetrahydropterin/6-carboxytetrahydropterin synthase